MSSTASPPEPVRVAIIGAGPSAFYAAEQLLRSDNPVVAVDMFDRLPTPFGLVRAGVAPDHLKIKTVTRAFTQIAGHPRYRFFGNVEFGRHLLLEDFQAHYDQILFATGAQTDRRLNIPGEDLPGSHAATEFVAWYNGHPDYRDCHFDLSVESAVVIGAGNVALDVARILCLSAEELHASDMAPHAVAALSNSRIRDIHVLARRGPAQAAFTNPEIKELGALAEAAIIVRPEEAALDPISAAEIEASTDRSLGKKVELIREYAACAPEHRRRRLYLRFLVSPVELTAGADGAVAGVRVVRNRLGASPAGSVVAEPTGEYEDLPAGLVFRSVGYRGVPLPGVPFAERLGVILNAHGRVLDPATNQPLPGMYVTGWIKRGPSGVIGTNKPCAVETVGCMIEDLGAARALPGTRAPAAAIDALLAERQPDFVTFAAWQRLDEIEVSRGQHAGRPRLKFTSIEAMLDALRGDAGLAEAS